MLLSIDKFRLNHLVILMVIFLLPVYACNNKEKTGSAQSSMFMADNHHSGNHKSQSVKTEPHLLWKVKTDAQVISSPVVVDNVVYIGSCDKKLYAINAFNGQIKWAFKTRGPINSTPLITHGKVLFLSYDGFFYALNQSDGELVWKFKTGGEAQFNVKDYYNGSFKPDFWDFYLSSAIAANDMVYFGSSDSNIYSLNIESGEKIWNYKTMGSIHSSPAIYKNSIVVGSWDSRIYCLDASTGIKNWSYSTGRDTANFIWLGIQASPSIDSGIVYIGSRDAKFYALNIEKGDTVWTNNNFNGSWMPSSAAIGKEYIYTGSSDSFSFFSMNKKTGITNYAANTNAYTFSSPAIDKEMAYIGSANGRLYGIDLDKGISRWEFQTIGCKADTLKVFNQSGAMDVNRIRELVTGVGDMPSLSIVYKDIFTGIGAILSSPAISEQIIYFGSSDGYVYAITDHYLP